MPQIAPRQAGGIDESLRVKMAPSLQTVTRHFSIVNRFNRFNRQFPSWYDSPLFNQLFGLIFQG